MQNSGFVCLPLHGVGFRSGGAAGRAYGQQEQLLEVVDDDNDAIL